MVSTTTKALAPVTGSDLVDMVTSDSFSSLVSECVSYTFETGEETGFMVIRALTRNRFVYSEIVFQENSDTFVGGHNLPLSSAYLFEKDIQYIDDFFYHLIESPHVLPVFDLHIHPQVNAAMPSSSDITSHHVRRNERFEYRPISAICMPNEQNGIDMLFYQALTRCDYLEMSPVIQAMGACYERKASMEEVLDELRKHEYNAESFSPQIVPEGVQIPTAQLAKLRTFAYQPTRV